LRGKVTYNKYYFERQPCAIRDHPSPRDVLQPYRIYKGREKSSAAGEKLKYGNAFCALCEGEELNQKS